MKATDAPHKLALLLFVVAAFFLPTASPQDKEKKIPYQENYSAEDVAVLRDAHAHELIRKEIEIVGARINNQDKMIDTQNTHIDQSLTILSISLTILGIFFTLTGFLGYFSVQRKAKREAEIASKEWFKLQAERLESEITSLQETVSILQKRAQSTFDTHVQKVQEDAEKAIIAIQKSIIYPDANNPEITKKDEIALAEAAKAAADKPESSYSFVDWNNRAFNAYKNGEKEEAARFWRMAAAQSGANPAQIARALINSGVSLAEANRNSDSISVFDEVIQKFSGSTALPVIENVLEAEINRAAQTGKMGQKESELALYDDIIKKYEDRTDEIYRNAVTIAIGNKGTALARAKKYDDALALLRLSLSRYGDREPEQRILKIRTNIGVVLTDLDKFDEAISVYEEIISLSSIDEDFKTVLAIALNGKGYAKLLQAKKNWNDREFRIHQLNESQSLFIQSLNVDASGATTAGNLAYCLFLLERPATEVRPHLTTTLQKGGRHLFEATLADTERHTIPTLDGHFRALVEDVWRTISPIS